MYSDLIIEEFSSKIDFKPILTLTRENLKFRYRISDVGVVSAYMISKEFREDFEKSWMVIYIEDGKKQILKHK